MNLYIFRHGEAVPAGEELPDEWRYLTATGVRETDKMAGKMTSLCRMPRLVVSSPLVRAVQTAQIVASFCGAKCRVSISGLLQPEFDPARVKEFLLAQAEEKRVMVVGHEPQLGRLVTFLLRSGTPFELKKSGCVALKLDPAEPDRPARFLFSIAPGKRTKFEGG